MAPRMKLRVVWIVALGSLGCARRESPPPAAPARPAFAAKLEAAVEDAFAKREMPGGAVVVVQGNEITYLIPKEGAATLFDFLAIPADAPHPDNAHAFLDYLMEPEVIAKVSNRIGYANGNRDSLPLLDARVRDDPTIYPPADITRALHPDTPESQPYIREANRAWTRIKTGQ